MHGFIIAVSNSDDKLYLNLNFRCFMNLRSSDNHWFSVKLLMMMNLHASQIVIMVEKIHTLTIYLA